MWADGMITELLNSDTNFWIVCYIEYQEIDHANSCDS